MADTLKDSLYSRAAIEALATAFAQTYPKFDRDAFLTRVFSPPWDDLSLMQRMRVIPAALGTRLPSRYPEAVEVICNTAPLLGGHAFLAVALSEFVAVFGLDDWKTSVPALAALTPFGTSEFAVRPFLLQDLPRMVSHMLEWTTDENEHVRRLASEGSRPRLPWGKAIGALKRDPRPILPILERLKGDPSEYVRRSVSNSLNDIAKDNADVTIAVLREWQPGASRNVHWIIERALRTLVKSGHNEALALLGFGERAQVEVSPLKLSATRLSIGESLTFTAEIRSTSAVPQRLVVDYVVYFVKSNGKQTPKVFKLTKRDLAPGESFRVARTIRFQPLTTRTYFTGEHAVALKINGEETASIAFHLQV